MQVDVSFQFVDRGHIFVIAAVRVAVMRAVQDGPSWPVNGRARAADCGKPSARRSASAAERALPLGAVRRGVKLSVSAAAAMARAASCVRVRWRSGSWARLRVIDPCAVRRVTDHRRAGGASDGAARWIGIMRCPFNGKGDPSRRSGTMRNAGTRLGRQTGSSSSRCVRGRAAKAKREVRDGGRRQRMRAEFHVDDVRVAATFAAAARVARVRQCGQRFRIRMGSCSGRVCAGPDGQRARAIRLHRWPIGGWLRARAQFTIDVAGTDGRARSTVRNMRAPGSTAGGARARRRDRARARADADQFARHAGDRALRCAALLELAAFDRRQPHADGFVRHRAARRTARPLGVVMVGTLSR